MQMSNTFLKVLFLVMLLTSSLFAYAETSSYQHQEIKVPLGFCWGDSPQKLEDIVRSGGLTITDREENPAKEKIVYTVRGVIGNGLEQNLFTFVKGGLVEIEYQYGSKKWDTKSYEDFFEAFRRMYDRKYGMGTELVKRNLEINKSGIITSFTGYQWTQANTVLVLYYYAAEQLDKSYRVVSLHYRAP